MNPPTRTDTSLGDVEERYLARVSEELADVPRPIRAPLIEQARAHLEERPPAANTSLLSRDLGQPWVYAAELRAEHGVRDHYRTWHRFRSLPVPVQAASALLVVTILAGAALVARQAHLARTETATFSQYCSGAIGDQAAEHVRVAGASEIRIPHHDGDTSTLALCLTADRDVVVTDITAELPYTSLIEPVELRRGTADGTVADQPFEPTPLSPDRHDTGAFALEVRHQNCRSYRNAGWSLTHMTVTYELPGDRTRTTDLELESAYTFVVPERCPLHSAPEGSTSADDTPPR